MTVITTAYLSADEYRALSGLHAAEIEKRRFRVGLDRLDFSLDRFDGALGGLWLAELDSDDAERLAALPDPPWATRDITRDSRYHGATLAHHGLPQE